MLGNTVLMSLRPTRPLDSMVRLTEEQIPGKEVESGVHKEVGYTTKELKEVSNSFKRKSGKYVWEWVLRVWDNGGRNLKLNQVECTVVDPLGEEDSRFNLEACMAKIDSKSFVRIVA